MLEQGTDERAEPKANREAERDERDDENNLRQFPELHPDDEQTIAVLQSPRLTHFSACRSGPTFPSTWPAMTP